MWMKQNCPVVLSCEFIQMHIILFLETYIVYKKRWTNANNFIYMHIILCSLQSVIIQSTNNDNIFFSKGIYWSQLLTFWNAAHCYQHKKVSWPRVSSIKMPIKKYKKTFGK